MRATHDDKLSCSVLSLARVTQGRLALIDVAALNQLEAQVSAA